jgi:AcrR family transcriptional regulator
MVKTVTDPRAIRTHEAVLSAAREILVAEGLDAVTHLNVAKRSGIGRKTLYRNWPTPDALLYDTLASANFPQALQTGDLRRDLTAHLEALRQALVHGPLAYVIHALNERATFDPTIATLRDRLTNEGCEPIRDILRTAVRNGQLPKSIDIEEAAGQLEGPLFYRTLVRNDQVPAKTIKQAVSRFLAEHLDPHDKYTR